MSVRNFALLQSNYIINEDDKAFQSRYLLLLFDQLQQVKSNVRYSDWLKVCELMSALPVDFVTLTWGGVMDDEAIQDCCQFIQAAIGRKRDRNAGLWGLLLYFMLMLNAAFQSGPEAQTATLEWVVRSANRMNKELLNHQSTIDRFILAVHQCRRIQSSTSVAVNQVIHLHNMRSTTSPFEAIFNGRSEWYAFEMTSVIAVLKNSMSMPFTESELKWVARKNGVDIRLGKSSFYNPTTAGWPAVQHIQDENGRNIDMPIVEDDLLDEQLILKDCLFVKRSYFDEVVEAAGAGSSVEVDFRQVVIESAISGKRINFHDSVTSFDYEWGFFDDWMGYRTLAESSFGFFCGAKNLYQCYGSNVFDEPQIEDEVVALNQRRGFSSSDVFVRLLDFYDYELHDDDAHLPPCLRYPMYKFRHEFVDADFNWQHCPSVFRGDDDEDALESDDADEQTGPVTESARSPLSCLGSNPRPGGDKGNLKRTRAVRSDEEDEYDDSSDENDYP